MKFVKIILSIFCFLSITTSIKAQVAGLGKEFFLLFHQIGNNHNPLETSESIYYQQKKLRLKYGLDQFLKKLFSLFQTM